MFWVRRVHIVDGVFSCLVWFWGEGGAGCLGGGWLGVAGCPPVSRVW